MEGMGAEGSGQAEARGPPGGRSKVKHWESCVAYGGGRVWMRSRRNVEILGVDGL